MTALSPVIARILLRYAGALLVGFNLSDDPDALHLATMAVGAAMGVAAEAWMWAAKRYGWSQ